MVGRQYRVGPDGSSPLPGLVRHGLLERRWLHGAHSTAYARAIANLIPTNFGGCNQCANDGHVVKSDHEKVLHQRWQLDRRHRLHSEQQLQRILAARGDLHHHLHIHS